MGSYVFAISTIWIWNLPFFLTIFSGKFFDIGYYTFLPFNFFGGGFVMAEIFQRSNLYYPICTKILSFSPFPSFIDGFSSLLSFEHRVYTYGPFSSFAEAYQFGWGYLAFLLLFLSMLVYQTTKMWRNNPTILSFFFLVPYYYSIIRMQAYPIRNVFRILLLALILAIISNQLLKKRKVKKFAGATDAK